MIEIEAAQEVLVRFPIAAVLRDDEAGHDFEQFTGAQHRPQVKLFRGHDAHASRDGITAEPLELTRNDDFFEPVRRGGNPAGKNKRGNRIGRLKRQACRGRVSA